MDEINLKEIFNILWNKKIPIIIILILFMIAGFLYGTHFVTPMYRAKTTLVLISASNNSNTITATDVRMNASLVGTYSKLIKSENVLSKVAENLSDIVDLEELESNVSVKSVQNTELIEITVKNEDPYNAAEIANEITDVFTERIQELYNINNVQLVSDAQVPANPYNTNVFKYIALFVAIGIAITAVYIIIANMLDTTIKSAEEIEKEINLPVLASIPNVDKKGGKN